MKPIFISFEGLDCCFKETNSKKLCEYIGPTARRYEFPDYNSTSSLFIKKYLAGDFKTQKGKLNKPVVLMYLMDMFYDYHEKILKDINEYGIKYIIFDRWWYSNLYYQARYPKDIDWIINIVNDLELPHCDYIFKMNSDPIVMLDLVHKKQSKNDIHESDSKFLLDTWDRFDEIELDIRDTTKVFDIETCDNELHEPKSPKDIFDDIKYVFDTYIKKE